MKILWALIALLILASPAATRQIIRDDPGGFLRDYRAAYESREPTVIDGPCNSSCTLRLHNPNLCITPRASFGFHAATLTPDRSTSPLYGAGTRRLWSAYPKSIRSWITANGGLQRDMIYLYGTALAGRLPACK